MLREIRYPVIGFGVTVVVCGAALPFEEHHFSRRDAECGVTSAEPRPLADCNGDGSLPHTRTVNLSPLANGTVVSTSVSSSPFPAPLAPGVFDADDVRPVEARMPFVNFAPSSGQLITARPLPLPPTISTASLVAYVPPPTDWRFVVGSLTPRST